MTRPLVHRSVDQELIEELVIGLALDIEFLRNPAGELKFIDSLNPIAVSLSQLLGGAAAAAEARVTGLRNQGSGLLSILNPSTVRIAAGTTEVLVERQAGQVAIEHTVAWPQTDIIVDGIGDPESYYVVEDVGFTGTGTVVEKFTPPTVLEERTPWLFLGSSIHFGTVVSAVINAPRVNNDQGHLLRDAIRASGGVTRTSGNLSEIAATLTHTRSAANLFGAGINFHTSFLDQNNILIAASATPAVFELIDPDGNEITAGATVFPTDWFDTGGPGVTALTGQRAVVHQIVITPFGQIVQMGTTNYANYQTAVANIGLERLMNPLWEPAERYGDTMGYAIVSAGSTVWLDDSAHIFEEVPFGSSYGGGGVTALDGLSDTPTNKIGANGQVLTVNAAETDLAYGKIRAQIMVPVGANVPSITLDVALPAHVNSFTFRIENVHLEVKVAPAADLEVDVRIAGSSVFGATLPKILAAALTGQLAPTTTDHFQGDRIRVDIATAAADWDGLVVTLEGWIVPE